MIEQRAFVLRADARTAIVQGLRDGGCGGCSASGGCGTSLLDRFLGRRAAEIEVANALGVSPGETVIIGMPEATLLKAAVAAYLGPLAGLILGAGLGRQLDGTSGTEVLTLLGAALGFAVSLRLVSAYSRVLASKPDARPVLLRREVSPSIPVSFG